MKIRRLSTIDSTFDADLKALLAFETAQDDSIDVVVANILKSSYRARFVSFFAQYP
jgi:histidinol dehydrogenase